LGGGPVRASRLKRDEGSNNQYRPGGSERCPSQIFGGGPVRASRRKSGEGSKPLKNPAKVSGNTHPFSDPLTASHFRKPTFSEMTRRKGGPENL